LTVSALACLLSSCALGEVGASKLEIEIEVRLVQNEPGTGEGYVVSYDHRAVHTTSDLALESTVSNTSWSGYETCFEPPSRIEWDSAVDFESFGFDDPDFHVVVRNGDVWLLYEPALEFGVVHAGRPACDSADGIAPGTTVGKRFFSGDLVEAAALADENPAYLRDDGLAVGGFVLAVAPPERLTSSEGVQISVERTVEEDDFRISLDVKGRVRAKS
jgi:hypothetical protein